MDVKQLTALVAVAEHGTFSSAAKALYTVQSNISTHIAKLERELSMTLVDRSTGELTEAGEVVLQRARRVLGEMDAVRTDLASLGAEVVGSVRAGVIGSTARWLVPRLLDALAHLHPKVRAVMVEASTSSLTPQLLSGQLDLALVNLPVDDPDIEVEPLFDEDLVLVAPKRHPLSRVERVRLEDLADIPVLLAPQGTGMRDDLDAAARAAGVTLQPLAEIDGVRLIASLAFEGFGPALLPATGVPALEGPWRRIPVDGVGRRSVGIARRRRGLLSAPARALVDIVHHVIAEQGVRQPGVHVRAIEPSL